MDVMINASGPFMSTVTLLLMIITALTLVQFSCIAYGDIMFPVVHKFRGQRKSLTAMRAHDAARHGHLRLLSEVEFSLGGNGMPSSSGLYYTKVGLGTPSKDYIVQIDTGSDILWVNCIECKECPTTSKLVSEDLSLFDPKASNTSSLVECGDVCTMMHAGNSNCKNGTCDYKIIYGDESSATGYFVKDNIKLNIVNGNQTTADYNQSVVFGCSSEEAKGNSQNEFGLDGIMGFGQGESSTLSQLAAAGKVKRVFSHCLDSKIGGGIFVIGEVASPEVSTTPILEDRVHYDIVLKSVEVGESKLQLPINLFDLTSGREAILDSGSTLCYLPSEILDPLLEKILAKQPGMKVHHGHTFSCFEYSGDVDEGFPPVKFNFMNSLTMTVYAHDYLFQSDQDDDRWCIGWQKSTLTDPSSGRSQTLLGDFAMANKLVMYDLENMGIGWTDYNCSSSIKLKNDKSKAEKFVVAHDITSNVAAIDGRVLSFLLLLFVMLKDYIH